MAVCVCVKGFSVLGVSEQDVLSSYSQFTNLPVSFSTQDMAEVPHSPAYSKQRSA